LPNVEYEWPLMNHQENIAMMKLDICDLKKRISNQIVLIQELSWDGHDTAKAKETLRILQDALKDWDAYQNLSLKLQPSDQAA
jgi:hypothetical protein